MTTLSPRAAASWRRSSRFSNAGLKVTDVVVLVDREQGGKAELARHGLALHAALTLSQVLDCLVRHGRVSDSVRADVHAALGAS